jgi:aspartate carbamoyltransferase catalytic subunit
MRDFKTSRTASSTIAALLSLHSLCLELVSPNQLYSHDKTCRILSLLLQFEEAILQGRALDAIKNKKLLIDVMPRQNQEKL